MPINHSNMHLGKLPRRQDSRTLRMARYMATPLPAAPLRVDYTQGITDWGMMLNDQLGCCTIAAVGHAVQAWTANAGKESTVPDSTVLNYYEQWDGYKTGDPSSDLGGVELNILNHWHQEGFLGHGLDAYAAIDLGPAGGVRGVPGVRMNSGLGIKAPAPAPGTPPAVSETQPLTPNPAPPAPVPSIAAAIWLFGGAYIGVQLPIRAQNQDVWDVPNELGPEDEPGSWGGHAVYLVGYDMQISGIGGSRLETENAGPRVFSPQPPEPGAQFPTLTCITWGGLKKMSWAWFEKYCDEAYALISCDFLEANGVSPSGFDFATLEKDLTLVTG